MVYGIAWRAWHGIWYGRVGMAWHMVWPVGHNMVQGMVWRGIAWYIPWPGNAWHGVWYSLWARHDIWYGLADMAWFMLWPGGHHMVNGMTWRGMSWYVENYRITCIKALPWAIVHWRVCPHIPDPFTSRGPFTCMFRSHVQLLFTLGRDSK